MVPVLFCLFIDFLSHFLLIVFFRMHGLTSEQIDNFGQTLGNTSLPLKARFRALFALRNVGDDRSVEWIGKCLNDESALLKHELAYCLGQMQNKSAIPILIKTLEDVAQEPMVRHEAGEALGAIGDISVLDLLKKYSSDPLPEVAETCVLAAARLEYVNGCEDGTKSPYDSVDPTPSHESKNVEELRQVLVDEKQTLWDRYRAMFTLRNINTDESITALASGLFCEDSALFRHEIAYVLGQVQSPVATEQLKQGDSECESVMVESRLFLSSENCMVRHECAEALGAIASDECVKILEEYAKDEERVVRESCEVALDMADYEQSGEFQYAGASH